MHYVRVCLSVLVRTCISALVYARQGPYMH